MPIDTQEFLKLADREDYTPKNGNVADYNYNGRRSGGGASSDAVEMSGKWAKLFQEHPEGGGPFNGRDNALVILIAFLRAKSVPYEAGLDWCQWWNRRYCSPPIDESDVHEKVGRLWYEWQAGGMEDVAPEDFKKEAGKPAERVLLTIDDLLDLDANGGGMEWLVPNVFAKAGTHFVSAPAAGAKSWLMLDLARCIASGDPWLGEHEVGQGAVLYVDEEMGDAKTSKRVRQLGFGRGLPFYYLGKQGVQINDPKDLKFIVDTCTRLEVKLVCLDTLTGVRPGLQENESSHVSQLRTYFNQITATGATLLIAHHDRKGGQGESDVAHYRMAGSRDFGAMADMAYGIEKRGSYYHLSVTKNRLLSEEDALEVDFVLEDNEDKSRVTLRIIDPSEKSERAVNSALQRVIGTLRAHSEEMSANALAEAVGGRKSVVLAAAKEGVDKGLLQVRVGERGSRFYRIGSNPF